MERNIAKNYDIFCQFRSKLTHNFAIKWKDKYDAVVVDCHHSLCLCGDRMKVSVLKKKYFFRETPTTPSIPFRVKFWPLGRLFCPSHPLAYSLVLRRGVFLYRQRRENIKV